jgi:DUF1680 family protein
LESGRAGMSSEISRRGFLAGAAAVAVAGVLPAKTGQEAATALREFDYGAVQLTGGPLKQHYDRIHASYMALDNDRLLQVYRERAGLAAPGKRMGDWYDADGFVPGHSLGQYISGLARMGQSTGDRAAQTKVGALVEGFGPTLGAKNQVFAGANAEKLWPCYVLDKHLAGLIDAYRLSGVDQARELLPRVFQGALPYIPERGRDRVGKKNPPYDETYVLPESLFTAWELSGERAFYDRAVAYLLDRGYFDPLARGEDVLPGRHAYSHAIALSSAGKAHLVLKDEKYLRAMENAWQFLVASQQYASGGWGPNEQFVEPHKGLLYESLRTTEDHFETPCGSYAAIKLARYLLCATGDGRYGDGLERVLYNCLLAAKDPDGDGDYPYYSTYGSTARKAYYPKKWPCCSGTLVEGVADYVKDIYFRTLDGVAVNLYAPSQLRWGRGRTAMILTQDTEYPLGQKIALRLDCGEPVNFALSLRIPGWIEGTPDVRVNGKPANAEMQRGFAVLRRHWKTGDRVSLELAQSFRTEAIDDLHPNTVAVMRGPLMYVEVNPTAESSGLPPLGGLRPVDGNAGMFFAGGADRKRVHAPFYKVRDESYTTYFEKS